MKIKFVFSGAGALYPVQAGALITLEDMGYIPEALVGTSGGAIIAGARACGYKGKELERIILESWPQKHNLIKPSLISLFWNWGLVDITKLQNVLKQYLDKTFAEVDIPLYIVATLSSTNETIIFSKENSPDMPIWLAVSASICIPIFFTPVVIEGKKYTDGGVTANFYLDLFSDSSNVIGLKFRAKSKNSEEPKSLVEYLMNNLNSLIEASTREHMEDAVKAKVIVLESKAKGLDFNLNDSQIRDMLNEGRLSVTKWIFKHKGLK